MSSRSSPSVEQFPRATDASWRLRQRLVALFGEAERRELAVRFARGLARKFVQRHVNRAAVKARDREGDQRNLACPPAGHHAQESNPFLLVLPKVALWRARRHAKTEGPDELDEEPQRTDNFSFPYSRPAKNASAQTAMELLKRHIERAPHGRGQKVKVLVSPENRAAGALSANPFYIVIGEYPRDGTCGSGDSQRPDGP